MEKPHIQIGKAVTMNTGQSQSAATIHEAFEGAYENGEYHLPPLPYDYNALEPLYDEKTLRIHHDKHHAAYVNGLNDALKKLEAARKSNDYSTVQHLSRSLAFNGSAHVLHTFFWHSMSPHQTHVPA